MRTKFIGTEFRRSFPFQTLDFFRCPLPYLSPAQGSAQEELQRCFDDVSIFNIPLQFEKLQIEDSLCSFLAGVLPQILEVKIGDLVDDQSRAATACVDLRSCGIDHGVSVNRSLEDSETFMEEIDDLGSVTLQKKDDTALIGIEKNGFETLQFEVPVDSSLIMQDHNYQSQMENMTSLFEIAKVHDLDMPTFELREQDFCEILQSLVPVVNDFTDSGVERKIHPVEDSGFTELDFRPTAFFLLEVDEASMSVFNDMPVEGALTSLLHIEFQKVAQDDDIITNEMEFLCAKKIDLLEYLSEPSLEMQGLDVELPPSNFLTDLNFIDYSEGLQHGEMMLHQQGKSDDVLAWLDGILLFEDFSFLDLEVCRGCEVFFDTAKVIQVEACEDMFGEAMKFRSFNELIVCNELTLADDLFKTLPAPILSDSEKSWSLQSFFQESLKELELEFPFDGLYLDWHVLEEESGGQSVYSSCWRTLEENDTGRIHTVLNCNDYEILVLNFVLSDDSLGQDTLEERNEALNIPLHDIFITSVCVKEVACDKMLNDNRQETDYGETDSEKVLESFNSMAQVNDSDDSFLNPEKRLRGFNCKPFEKSVDSSKLLFLDCSKDSIAACGATELPLLGWNVKLHQIKLSDEILEILDNLGKNFLVILESDKELKDTLFSSQGLDDLSLLRIPKEKLINQIEKAGFTGTLSAHGSEKLTSLVALSAIKQMAWYLCYYGFHSSYLYICKLVEGMQCLTDRLNFLQNLIKMYEEAEKEIFKFHPSFSVVKELLESNVCQSSKKMLIVTERFFWWPLKRLLKSMKISCNEPQNFVTHGYHANERSDCADAKKINFSSDCCLVSHEYINASFPFSKFHAVLEYGGPSASSRISTSFPKLDDFPLLYFLKVDVEDSAVAKALCHGVNMPKPFSSRTEDDYHLISMMSNTKNNVIELLSFMPLENLNLKPMVSVDEDGACSTILPCVSQFTESEKMNGHKPSSLGKVIIVNTQNLDKEMIISRRSTYQRILALEKLGVEVVERDLDLPVDILVDAEVCLAWYELKNIRRKASAADEAFSCLPLCIENIAASILTSLSLAFSSCILIFEGEKGFIAGVMESSDELYAAAASLGIDLQIFYSYASDMTDKILLSTIETAANIRGASYPKMNESESLAESFLTAFPSINPLSAHAILSHGGTLGEFLELSLDCRVQAVQKFKIPGEAVSLFTLLTKYGEREDSKSGMTDSSSSVSYAPAMQKYQMKSYFDDKKRKYDEDLLDVDIRGNKTDIEPLKLFSDGRSNPSKSARSNEFWGSENLDAVGELEKPCLYFNDKLFAQREELDANMIKGTFVFPGNDFQTAGVPLMSEKMKNGDNSWNDMVSDANEIWGGPSLRSMKQDKVANSWNQMDDFVGEVIDIDDLTSRDVSNACFASSPASKIGKDPSEQAHGVAKKLFSSSNSLPSFSISGQNKFDKDSCFPIDNRQKRSATIDSYYLNSSFNKCTVEDNALRVASKFQDLPANEGEYYGGTPLWNAVHSNECIGQSPWTIEFLNGIKAKSKFREHALPPDLSAPCVGRSRSMTKAMKRKSPSIIEFYRYQGGSVGKTVQQREKRFLQQEGSSKSRNRRTSAPARQTRTPLDKRAKRTSAPALQTWTPLDKRAKRTLSFATTGNGAQSKLIWSDNKSQAMSSRMVHQV